MKEEFGFEKLRVWQKGKRLAIMIYSLTRNFPDSEKYGLSSQLRRAAVSVSSNLAEGSSRSSSKEKARFAEISYGSLTEVVSQLEISVELGYLSRKECDEIKQTCIQLARMISGFRRFNLERRNPANR